MCTPVFFTASCPRSLGLVQGAGLAQTGGANRAAPAAEPLGGGRRHVEADRLLGKKPCPASEVMVRIIRPLTALQVRLLQVEGLLLLPPLLPPLD